MRKNIPYKYYKRCLLITWALSLFCVISTWIGFAIGGTGTFIFAGVVNGLLAFALLILSILLFLSGRQDYVKRAILFSALMIAHLAFFVCCYVMRDKVLNLPAWAYYLLPTVHTLLLIAISVIGVYFWIRNKFTFKTMAQEDAHVAFGGPIDEPVVPKEQPVQPEEPKPIRDEKTGIVSI